MTVYVCGIDVSKDRLDACLLREGLERGEGAAFPNSPEGHEALRLWARGGAGDAPLRLAMEATGAYHKALLRHLRAAGEDALALNPRRCRDLARGLGLLDKDDAVDARVVALAVAMSRPGRQRAEGPLKEALREVSRRVEAVGDQLARERTRLREPRLSAAVEASIRRSVAFLEEEAARLEREWREAVRADEALERAYRLALSVPQVGPKTARVLVSELPDPTDVGDPRRACGLAGLVPRRRRSGERAAPDRLSPCCNRRLKRAMYMPAVQALRRSPELRELYDRLVAKGRHHQQAIAAVMRRVLLRALQVLARGTPWEDRPLTP